MSSLRPTKPKSCTPVIRCDKKSKIPEKIKTWISLLWFLTFLMEIYCDSTLWNIPERKLGRYRWLHVSHKLLFPSNITLNWDSRVTKTPKRETVFHFSVVHPVYLGYLNNRRYVTINLFWGFDRWFYPQDSDTYHLFVQGYYDKVLTRETLQLWSFDFTYLLILIRTSLNPNFVKSTP